MKLVVMVGYFLHAVEDFRQKETLLAGAATNYLPLPPELLEVARVLDEFPFSFAHSSEREGIESFVFICIG